VARFLWTGRAAGAQVVDGLTMLVGQAAKAFELFFGEPAPAPDEALRSLLTAPSIVTKTHRAIDTLQDLGFPAAR